MSDIVSKANIRFQRTVLIIGTVLLAIKFFSWYLTHSNAILTDALESIINVVAGAFALWSLVIASRPKDSDHPYGHGKVEFLSSGLEGAFIALAGVYMAGKAVYNFFYPIEVHSLDIGIAITAFTGIVNYILGFYLNKKGEKSNSHAMMAEGKHLQSDAWSSAGLLAGLFLIFLTKIIWLDNVVAILLGIYIFDIGYKLIRTSLRVIKYGSKLHVDCHITLPWFLNLRESHDEAEKLDKLINTKKQGDVEFFIHTDPCIPTSCRICQKTDCTVRQFPMVRKIEWKLENVLSNKKHGS